jgi:hypothetical protein
MRSSFSMSLSFLGLSIFLISSSFCFCLIYDESLTTFFYFSPLVVSYSGMTLISAFLTSFITMLAPLKYSNFLLNLSIKFFFAVDLISFNPPFPFALLFLRGDYSFLAILSLIILLPKSSFISSS